KNRTEHHSAPAVCRSDQRPERDGKVCGLGPNVLAASGARSRLAERRRGAAAAADPETSRRRSTTRQSHSRPKPHAESIMAGSVNKVILIGNLGADPEISRTHDGRTVA